MKKLMLIALTIILTISLAACSGKVKDTGKTTMETTEQEKGTEQSSEVDSLLEESKEEIARYKDYSRVKDYKFESMDKVFSQEFSFHGYNKMFTFGSSNEFTLECIDKKRAVDVLVVVDSSQKKYLIEGSSLKLSETNIDKKATVLKETEDLKAIKRGSTYTLYSKVGDTTSIVKRTLKEGESAVDEQIVNTMTKVAKQVTEDKGLPYISDIMLKRNFLDMKIKSYADIDYIEKHKVGTMAKHGDIFIELKLVDEKDTKYTVGTSKELDEFLGYKVTAWKAKNVIMGGTTLELRKGDRVQYVEVWEEDENNIIPYLKAAMDFIGETKE